MNDDEMNNFDLVEALMKRASGNETKEEGDKLGQLLSSGAISDIDMNNANNNVNVVRQRPLRSRHTRQSIATQTNLQR